MYFDFFLNKRGIVETVQQNIVIGLYLFKGAINIEANLVRQ